MLNWMLVVVAEQHRRELLQQAQRQRLARQLKVSDRRGRLSYRHLMLGLGRRLVAVGGYLQEQFGEVDTVSALPATHLPHQTGEVVS